MSAGHRNTADVLDILEENGVPVIAVESDMGPEDWHQGNAHVKITVSVPVFDKEDYDE